MKFGVDKHYINMSCRRDDTCLRRFKWVLRYQLDTNGHFYLRFISTKSPCNELAAVAFILKDNFQESRN
jgi:hypothetical protein